ncbi:MAG: ATP-binding cassette domain-containing protein [Gammaproteobacteria bacterium]
MIETHTLRKSFGDVHAVQGASFAAQNGAISTLLGANGSGKTTTLRMLCGLLAPDQGRVTIDSVDVAQDPMAARRRLGVFPDPFGLYPRLTAREHIHYFARFHGLKGAKLRDATTQVAELLQMGELLDRRCEGFSQGQRMKVALARALVHRPPNVILDEPTRGLDVISVRLLRRVLRRMADDGCCVLLSSHSMADVESLSDNVIIIDGGRVVHTGAPQDLIASTQTPNLEEAFIALTQREAA